jgi:leader peptidase (prepilin peptidase)/N-methyltransferase
MPASHCPACNTPITPWENIPIISYLMLKGKCRYCKEEIPVRYIIVEILSGIIYMGLYWKYGLSFQLFYFGFFASILIIISFIDLEHYLILNKLSYPSAIFGVILGYHVDGNFIDNICGVLTGAGIIYLIVLISSVILQIIDHPCKDKGGMGLGDVKLAGMIGAFFCWKFVLIVLFLSFLFGSIVGLILIILGIKKRTDYIPFGPYLALGAITIIFGEQYIVPIIEYIFP